MKKNRFVSLALIIVCFFVLTAQSCWDFVLEKRVCPLITLELDQSAGTVTIPDCVGDEPLFTVFGRETVNFVGLNEELLEINVNSNNNILGTFELTATGFATPGTSSSFIIDFEPRGRGRFFRPFDQEVEVLVIFICTGTPEECGDSPPTDPPAGCSEETVPRDQACDTLSAAVASWLQRCNPSMPESEATRLAQDQICGDPDNPIDDATVTYDATAAQNCGCDIVDMRCDAPDPFTALKSCSDMLTGPLGLGFQCENDDQCETGYCLQVGDGCGGICEESAAAGESCIGVPGFPFAEVLCEAGTYCDISQDAEGDPIGFCEPLPKVGEPCVAEVPCEGEDAYLLPTAGCLESTNTCQEVIKDGPCDQLECHQLYTCNEASLLCEQLPGENDPCALAIDVADPTQDQWLALIDEASSTCRVAPDLFGAAGEFCVQSGPTTGMGTCQALPALGETCGLGEGLSPRCAPGAYCDVIDVAALGPATGTCVEGIAENGVCDSDWEELGLGSQCAADLACVDGRCQLSCSVSEEEGGV